MRSGDVYVRYAAEMKGPTANWSLLSVFLDVFFFFMKRMKKTLQAKSKEEQNKCTSAALYKSSPEFSCSTTPCTAGRELAQQVINRKHRQGKMCQEPMSWPTYELCGPWRIGRFLVL